MTVASLWAALWLALCVAIASAGSSSCDIGQYWSQIPGSLSWVSSGNAGVWGVNSLGQIYYRTGSYVGQTYYYQSDGRNYGFSHSDGTGWTQVAGSLSQLDVGQDSVWGVQADGSVFYRSGISSTNPVGTDWVRVDGYPMARVSVGDDGKVWAVVAVTGFVYRRAGISDELPGGSGWEFVSGPTMSYVDAGGAGVWGVTPGGDVYYRVGSRKDCQGSSWIRVRTPTRLNHIASGGDNVWGVSAAGDVYFRLNITSVSITGNEWVQIPGNIKQLSTSTFNNALWSVDTYNNVYSRHP